MKCSECKKDVIKVGDEFYYIDGMDVCKKCISNHIEVLESE